MGKGIKKKSEERDEERNRDDETENVLENN
jgi:hypothetical protein